MRTHCYVKLILGYTKKLQNISIWKNRWFLKDEENESPEHLQIDMADRIQVKGLHLNIILEMVRSVPLFPGPWYENRPVLVRVSPTECVTLEYNSTTFYKRP